jgi:hypothetical protein
MKYAILAALFCTSLYAQSNLTPAEKEMVELGRKAADEPQGQMASKRMQDRMQAEMGTDEETRNCKYDLVGANIPTESVVEKSPLDLEACKSRALKTLQENPLNYTKVLVKHPALKKWVVIEKKR